MRNVSVAAMTVGLFIVAAIPADAQTVKSPEVYSATSAAASAIESRENGVTVTRDESPGAENERERAAGASELPKEAAYQDLTDSDWWWENDALTFGYLPGFYGGAFYGGCGPSVPPSWTGPAPTQWWNAPSTNAWFPAGKPLPFPYGSGYGCGGYNHGVPSSVVFANRRGPARKNMHHQQSNARARPSIRAARAASQPSPELADAEWTRVADVRDQRGGAPGHQGNPVNRIPSSPAMRTSGQISPARRRSVQHTPAAAIRVARSGRVANVRTSLGAHSIAAHPASVHVNAARVGGVHGRT